MILEVKAVVNIKASMDDVWQEITHHKGMEKWPGIDKVLINKEGKTHPDGVGCIRSVDMGRMFVKEKITRYDIHEQMDYLVDETNMPFLHLGGTILFAKKEDHVNVIWKSKIQMTSKLWIVKFVFGKIILWQGNSGFQKSLNFVKNKLEA